MITLKRRLGMVVAGVAAAAGFATEGRAQRLAGQADPLGRALHGGRADRCGDLADASQDERQPAFSSSTTSLARMRSSRRSSSPTQPLTATRSLTFITAQATNKTLYAGKTKFDLVKSFEPISLVSESPLIICVSNDLPVKTVGELIAYAKKNPGKISYGSTGSARPRISRPS